MAPNGVSHPSGFRAGAVADNHALTTNEHDPSGLPESMQYPSRRSYVTAYDHLARPTQRIRNGASVVQVTDWNSRLQVSQIHAAQLGGQTPVALLKLEYGYGITGNNGDLRSQKVTSPSLAQAVTQTYTYDKLSRLRSVVEGTASANVWQQNYVYDRWGNRALLDGTVGGVSAFKGPGSMAAVTADQPSMVANQFPGNRWTGATYDTAGVGNVIGYSGTPEIFAYDAENRMVCSSTSGTEATCAQRASRVEYTYDANGRRVKKTVFPNSANSTTVYVYDPAGQLAAEYNGQSGPTALRYVVQDHLGSTRLHTDAQGIALTYFDYAPFGEDLPEGLSGRNTKYSSASTLMTPGVDSVRFTGKERDAESRLDYFGARYLAPGQGRFTSPDAPFADQESDDPQSWNLYYYAGNNPLTYIDSDGRGKIKAATVFLQRLQVGFRQVMIRHEGKNIGFKEAKDRLTQDFGDVIFEGESSALRAAGGRSGKPHSAHTNTAGPNALPHAHPTTSAGKKMKPHAFHRNNIVVPGAAIGVLLLGDNAFGETLDVFNPLSDAQGVATILDESVIPTILGFIDDHLMRPGQKPTEKPKEELRPKITVRLCDDAGNCVVQ